MLAASLCLSIAVWAALVLRIIGDPVNHIGLEPLMACGPFVMLMIVAWLPRYRRRVAMRLAVTAFALLSVAAVVALDRDNEQVQYERWCQRGMPERPCGRFARHVWSCYP
jgi:hypothetical protein